jgi:ribonuclease P protein component
MMLTRELRLTRKADFDAVIAAGRRWGSQHLTLRASPNDMAVHRIGFAVSKTVGNAIVRNRVKRRLRAIVQIIEVLPGYDVVISARPSTADVPFQSLKDDFLSLLKRAKLIGKVGA